MDRIAAPLGVDVDRDHQRQRHHHPGSDAGHEEAADRHRDHPAPDHHQDGRRNDHAHHRGAGDQRDRERRVVALLLHRRDQHAADARGLRRRRAGNAGEQHRHQHVDVAQSTRQVADQGAREVDQLLRDAGRIHQVGSEHEERHRQQQERVVGLQHLVEQQERRQPVVDEEHRDAGQAERERDRHPQRSADAEDAEQDQRDFKRRPSSPLPVEPDVVGELLRPGKANQHKPASGQAAWIAQHVDARSSPSSAASRISAKRQPKREEDQAPRAGSPRARRCARWPRFGGLRRRQHVDIEMRCRRARRSSRRA